MTDCHEDKKQGEDPHEEWRDIPGWEGLYQVSNLGRVCSVDRVIVAKGATGGPRRYPSKIREPFPGKWGHLHVSLFEGRTEKRYSVHSLVAQAFIGPRPDGLVVCHNDGDPSNNCPENLRYDTASGNMLDAVKHGTQWQVKKAQCPRFHEYVSWNLVPSQTHRGGRKCLACSRASSYTNYHRELRPDIDAIADKYYNALKKENS